jgi:hypothetical protein
MVDTKFSARLSGILSLGNTDNMDPFETFYPDACHMDPTNVGPRRYGEVDPYQFSEISVLMGDEPEVSDLVIQWRTDTTDLYRGIKIIREDHRSGDAFRYRLLFPYGT